MKNIKLLTTLFLTSITLNFNSQISINAGTGILKGFTVPKPFFGFHCGLELPRANDVTFYGKLGYYFPQKEEGTDFTYVTATNPNASPQMLSVNYVTKANYVTIEGGTRRYIINDYDNGFSLYGGSNFMLVFNTVKRDYEKLDVTGTYQWEQNYQTDINEQNKGSILSVAAGLQGGLKYTVPATGTVYFDINGQYALFGKANNLTALNASNTILYSQLFFTFNVGFRKDLY